MKITRKMALGAWAFMGSALGFGAAIAQAQTPTPTPLNYKVSWIGNTFGKENSGKWVQNNIADLYVAPDGTCYTNSNWDEGHHEGGIYKNGDYIGKIADLHGTHWWGGHAVTGDASFLYVANGNQLRRHSLSGARGTWTATTAGRIFGMSVDKVNGLIYVANDAGGSGNLGEIRDYTGKIEVYNLTTQALVRSWNASNVYRVAVAPDGSVWTAQRPSSTVAGKVSHYSATGTLLSQSIVGGSGNPGFDPTALVFDGAGRLLVGDNGPHQQVKIYTSLGNTSPTLGATFGAQGGIFSGTAGLVAPLKFNGITGLGVDSSGNIYVAQNRFGPDVNYKSTGGGSILESYTASGTRNWQLLGLEFVDCADVTPGTDGTEIYTKYSRYTLDFSKTNPGGEWTYKGHTMNRFKYPDDERYKRRLDNYDFSTGYLVRNIGGKKIQFNASMWGYRLEVYRFNAATDGEIAIPCGMVQDHQIWRDLNGNGARESNEWTSTNTPSGNSVSSYWVDTAGDLWQSYFSGPNGRTGVRRYASQGVDANGSPIWNTSSPVVVAPIAEFNEIYRMEYVAQSDTMYLAGYGPADPAHYYNGPNFNGKGIGSIMARYDNWSTGNRTARWVQILPQYTRTPTSMSIAGDYVFIGYDGLTATPDSGDVRVLRGSDGVDLGRMWAGPPAFNSESNLGRMDIENGVRAFKRANGEYIVLTEEDFYGRIMMYRWTPGGTTTTPTSWNPGFEDDNAATQSPRGWSEYGANPEASYVEGGSPRSGTYKAAHWKGSPYSIYTHQTRTGIPNGLYQASVWAKSGGTVSSRYLEVKDYGGGATLRANLPVTGTWTRVVLSNINITNGQMTWGIASNGAAANAWANFDDFEFVPMTTRFEAENLSELAISSGDVVGDFAETDTGLSNNSSSVFTPNAANDFVTYGVDVPQPGTYRILVRVRKGNNRGIFQLATADSVGGTYTNRGASQDHFNTTSTLNTLDLGTVTFDSAGTKAFRFTCTGKNGSSTAFRMAWDYLELVAP